MCADASHGLPPRPITDYDASELSALVATLGEKPYRAKQIHANLYKKLRTSYSAMTDLSAALRQRLAGAAPLLSLSELQALTSADGLTTKMLLQASDGQKVEAVSIREDRRHTVCVSSQVGCAMGCVFCASGLDGLARNLHGGEIVEQVLAAQREHGRVTNVVFMGMGEPLANFDRLMHAVRTLNDPDGFALGARRMTVSTVGLVSGIRRLAREGMQLNLAISLHAPDDATRGRIVPATETWSVEEIVDAAREYVQSVGRRITFEYTLLAGINDSLDQARALADLARPLRAKINLIPCNPVEGLSYQAPPSRHVSNFAKVLTEAGCTATTRKEKGRDVRAACGQLRRQVDDLAV